MIRAIDSAVSGQRFPVLRNISRRAAKILVGTGLVLTTAGAARAQNVNNTYNQENIELTASNTDSNTTYNKDLITGNAALGLSILAMMGVGLYKSKKD